MPDDLLAIAEKWWTPDPRIVARLPRGGREPNARCNYCGGYHKTGAAHLDFVGHADLTRALIEIDPGWQWEPIAWTDEGLPRIVQRDKNYVLWGRLTLLGKTMLCVGTCEVSKTEADKELVGDLLRNGGMRFGIFGALWSKTDGWQDDTAGEAGGTDSTESQASHRTAGVSLDAPHISSPEPLPPVAISQPDKPLAAMTMRELLDFASVNGITVSGTKTEIVRILEPLVRAASGDEPWPVEGEGESAGGSGVVTEQLAAPSRPEPEAIPFEPVVFEGAAADSGSARQARNSAAKTP